MYRVGADGFDWPRRDDIDKVHVFCVFFGPVTLQVLFCSNAARHGENLHSNQIIQVVPDTQIVFWVSINYDLHDIFWRKKTETPIEY